MQVDGYDGKMMVGMRDLQASLITRLVALWQEAEREAIHINSSLLQLNNTTDQCQVSRISHFKFNRQFNLSEVPSIGYATDQNSYSNIPFPSRTSEGGSVR